MQLWWTSVIIIIVERRNPVRREDLARLSRGGLSVISGRRRAIRRCGKTKSCNGEGEVYFAMSRERVVGCRTLASGKEFGTNRQNGCDVGGSSNRRKGFRLRGADRFSRDRLDSVRTVADRTDKTVAPPFGKRIDWQISASTAGNPFSGDKADSRRSGRLCRVVEKCSADGYDRLEAISGIGIMITSFLSSAFVFSLITIVPVVVVLQLFLAFERKVYYLSLKKFARSIES